MKGLRPSRQSNSLRDIPGKQRCSQTSGTTFWQWPRMCMGAGVNALAWEKTELSSNRWKYRHKAALFIIDKSVLFEYGHRCIYDMVTVFYRNFCMKNDQYQKLVRQEIVISDVDLRFSSQSWPQVNLTRPWNLSLRTNILTNRLLFYIGNQSVTCRFLKEMLCLQGR